MKKLLKVMFEWFAAFAGIVNSPVYERAKDVGIVDFSGSGKNRKETKE